MAFSSALFIVAVAFFGSFTVGQDFVLGKHHPAHPGSGGKSPPSSSWNYILAYTWSPGFCSGQSYPGCQNAGSEYLATHFTLHGLWPQYNTTSGYPADCSTEAFSQSAVDAVGEDKMIQYWPNVQEAEGSSTYSSFWEHEWTKHGTCSGLSQVDYYNAAIDTLLELQTPSVVSSNVGNSVSASSIRDAFGGASFVALQCNGGNQLTGAFTCWSRAGDLPTAQVQCVGDVVHEDTCTSSSVLIVSL